MTDELTVNGFGVEYLGLRQFGILAPLCWVAFFLPHTFPKLALHF